MDRLQLTAAWIQCRPLGMNYKFLNMLNPAQVAWSDEWLVDSNDKASNFASIVDELRRRKQAQ